MLHEHNWNLISGETPDDRTKPIRNFYRCASCGARGEFLEWRNDRYWEDVDDVLNDLGVGTWLKGEKVDDGER